MNDGLIDALRHNAWATLELLRVCQGLSERQLDATTVGTYGSIIDTLRHIVSSEASYLVRLTGEEPSWDRRAAERPDLGTLAKRIEELAARWERFLAEPFDAERNLVIRWPDGTDYNVPAGVVLAQALHHGNEHRGQICAILTSIGVTPPELGVWEYAEATGRARPRRE
jgi:uncharacterized damage-inducible protein DinB